MKRLPYFLLTFSPTAQAAYRPARVAVSNPRPRASIKVEEETGESQLLLFSPFHCSPVIKSFTHRPLAGPVAGRTSDTAAFSLPNT
ncbi:hypothetical protein B0H13DRAFT_2349329 [Mycena leptocephala]|nr:hypothetical protein B0H13DRAFT_2349329 [Mycena leptocephala]